MGRWGKNQKARTAQGCSYLLPTTYYLAFERELNRLGRFRPHGDFLVLRLPVASAERRPGLHRVVARRKPFNREGPVAPGHSEERVLGHADVRPHPRMLVALH